MRKGFTLVEVLLLIVAIILFIGIAVTAITGEEQTPQTEEQQCAWYQNYPQKDLPAKCLKYYK